MPGSDMKGKSYFAYLPVQLLSERNVLLTLGFSVAETLGHQIAHGHVFTIYIFELYGDNKSVGFCETITGVTALVCALLHGTPQRRTSPPAPRTASSAGNSTRPTLTMTAATLAP